MSSRKTITNPKCFIAFVPTASYFVFIPEQELAFNDVKHEQVCFYGIFAIRTVVLLPEVSLVLRNRRITFISVKLTSSYRYYASVHYRLKI